MAKVQYLECDGPTCKEHVPVDDIPPSWIVANIHRQNERPSRSHTKRFHEEACMHDLIAVTFPITEDTEGGDTP